MDYINMTTEELIKILSEQPEITEQIFETYKNEIATLKDSVSTLTKENNDVKDSYTKASADLEETKKLNFNLAKLINSGNNSASIEQELHKMFGKGGN